MSFRTCRLRRVHVASFAFAVCFLCASWSWAATFRVDTTEDHPAATACDDGAANDCSLRGAVVAGNALPDGEMATIEVPAGEYVLTQSSDCTWQNRGHPFDATTSQIPLCLTGRISIRGAGADVVAVDAANATRVLYVDAGGIADIEGVTIRNGLGDRTFFNNPHGGGILNHGVLTLTEVVVSDNFNDPVATGAGGSGIYNAGSGSELTLIRSVVTRNGDEFHQLGGGIRNDGDGVVTVIDSIVSRNTTGHLGGGIANNGGTVTIMGSAIVENLAKLGDGGGIANLGFGIDTTSYPGELKIINSTISGNESGGSGGGIYNHSNTVVDLNNATIAFNDGAKTSGTGGGLYTRDTAGIFVRNTIIARNTDGVNVSEDCSANGSLASAPLISQGHNLIGHTTNCVLDGDTTGNILDQDPLLAPLAGSLSDVGGTTPSHALLPGSPAIDGGNDDLPPGSGGASCAAIDQRGFVRPQGVACDMGATEGVGAFTVTSVVPQRAGNSGAVTLSIFGSGIEPDATVELQREGEAAIAADPVVVAAGRDVAYATFDLSGAALGTWTVSVTNTVDTAVRIVGLPDAVTVEPGETPQLWVDVVGHTTPRVGRLTRYFVSIGNRSNTDALNVPLTLSVPFEALALPLLRPPVQDGQVEIDWFEDVPASLEPNTVTGDARNLSLLLPVVPAGFAGMIEARLDLPLDLGGQTEFLVVASVDDPLSAPDPLPQPLDAVVSAAHAYLQRTFALEVTADILEQMREYARAQLESTVAEGRAVLAASAGGNVPLYSLSQLEIDVALFGFARAEEEAEQAGLLSRNGVRGSLAFLMQRAARWTQRLAPPSACAQQDCPPYDGRTLVPGCSADDPPFQLPPEIEVPKECDLRGVKKVSEFLQKLNELPNCSLPPDSCLAMPNRKIEKGRDGKDYCVGDKCKNFGSSQPFSAENGSCKPYPIRPINSRDPNDKHGTIGAADGRFVVRGVPLTYTIRFENVETATAPAQEVVITDPLDKDSLDLATFRLGPMTFGEHSLSPAAGVSQYSGGIDLRPDRNLIVSIEASLDPETGVALWRFTSVDPETLQFPEDPLAGFLPPNVTEPEGEGSVTFTVEQKGALPSGTEICNEASIVFDVNEPIATPPWCNTIDEEAPASAVAPLEAAQPGPLFEVDWSGSDAHAGVAGYTVYVSAGGGPFEPWLEDTAKTAAVYAGEAGETYAFYTVATDHVGNVEAAPGEVDASTVVRAGCGRPVTTGATPTATDCLFILRAAVGSETCEPACVCDVSGEGSQTAVDALFCLKKAVGQNVALACACPVITTTTTTTSTTTTTTLSPPTTSASVPAF